MQPASLRVKSDEQLPIMGKVLMTFLLRSRRAMLCQDIVTLICVGACCLQILELMGGEHADISEAAKGLHNIEITGSDPSEKQENE